MIGWRTTLPALVIVVLASTSAAQDAAEIPLWPAGAPHAPARPRAEQVRIAEGGDHVVSAIDRPSITPYVPPNGMASGAAIIIAPGGGHRELWIDHEGYNPARWLRDHGVAAFVLKYRLAKEDSSPYTVDDDALADMQRAIRLVRSRAAAWGIDTARIGVMGFSAGGEVAALSAMRGERGSPNAPDAIDRLSSRPAFQVLIYPGNSARFTVSSSSPPVFIACGYKDRPDISTGMAELYLKYKQAGVPAELHVYANAGHGFGLRPTNTGAIAAWPTELMDWLGEQTGRQR